MIGSTLVLDLGLVSGVTIHLVVHGLEAAVGQVDEVVAVGVLAVALLLVAKILPVVVVFHLVAIFFK